jgi:hypothetical protein
MSPSDRQRRWISWLLVGGGLLVAAVVAAGVWWFEYRPPVRPSRPVVLLVTGDTAGWIVPCGCTSNQSGGLLRRGTFVAGLTANADVILTDVGGAPGGTSLYQRVKFEAILRGECAMGLTAHNVGGPEAALGADYLRRTSGEIGVPFVSANLRDADGSLVASPLLMVERGGRRVAIVGVLSRRYEVSGLQIDDPRTAVLREASSAKGRYDSLIVLAYLPEDELQQLAAGLPEADAVIGGPTGQSIAPRQLGPTVLASATNKGKFVVRLDAMASTRGWTGQVVEMDADLPDDENQQANVKSYLEELARKNFAATETGLSPKLPATLPRDYKLVGNMACQSCHAADCSGWAGSKHSRAWQTLLDRGQHVDPYCQQCHATGYGLPGGFTSATGEAHARSVGCESCHGPSAGHARTPKVRTPFAARDQCVTCHDRENSPLFAYEPYWSRIRHGGPATLPHGESKGKSP